VITYEELFKQIEKNKKLTDKEFANIIKKYQKDGYKIHPSEYVKFLSLIIM